MDDVLAEIRSLAAGDDTHDGVAEIVLVAQDLASYGRDRSASGTSGRARGTQPIVELVRAATELVERTRLLYLYPSGLTDDLVEAMLAARVAYFDLSLQHVSRPLLARMRRWGDGERFVERIEAIRSAAPEATFRSSFIHGYPGETEEDHDRLLEFLRAAELDWAGFFTFSPEDGTYAEGLGDQVPAELALERLRECAELQDAITAQRRDALVGAARQVLIDAPGIGRTIGEAPEIDGIVRVDPALPVGRLVDMVITASLGTDLEAVAATALAHQERVPAGRGAA
jgi:ribosomal protein S12 methylthiotransferase